jgi:hypothetical protein
MMIVALGSDGLAIEVGLPRPDSSFGNAEVLAFDRADDDVRQLWCSFEEA